MYSQCDRWLEIQILSSTLFVTIFEWFLLQSDHLKQVKTIETARWVIHLAKGARPFNRGQNYGK